jgi:hypothetical protein
VELGMENAKKQDNGQTNAVKNISKANKNISQITISPKSTIPNLFLVI